MHVKHCDYCRKELAGLTIAINPPKHNLFLRISNMLMNVSVVKVDGYGEMDICVDCLIKELQKTKAKEKE